MCESSRKPEVMTLSPQGEKRRGALDEAGDVKEGSVTELASLRAQRRAQIARWDINIVVFLFAVLILVVILLYENVVSWIVGPIAFVGLILVWLVGWRRGKQLYRLYLEEEISKLDKPDREAEKLILDVLMKSQREKAENP